MVHPAHALEPLIRRNHVIGTNALCFCSPRVWIIPCILYTGKHLESTSPPSLSLLLLLLLLLSLYSDSANFGRAPALDGNCANNGTLHQSELVSQKLSSLRRQLLNLWLPETMTLAKPPIVFIDTPRSR